MKKKGKKKSKTRKPRRHFIQAAVGPNHLSHRPKVFLPGRIFHDCVCPHRRNSSTSTQRRRNFTAAHPIFPTADTSWTLKIHKAAGTVDAQPSRRERATIHSLEKGRKLRDASSTRPNCGFRLKIFVETRLKFAVRSVQSRLDRR